MQEMINSNILIPYISISKAHGKKEIEYTLKAFKKFSIKFSHAILKDKLFLNSEIKDKDVVKPVFRKFN